MEIGKRIKQFRTEKSLTQTELGEKLGVIKQTVSSWENGISSPGNDLITAMAELFNVSTDYLLGITDIKFPYGKTDKHTVSEERDEMFNQYKWFFDCYLHMCKGMYNSEEPYGSLSKCIEACNARSWELFGMLQLLRKMDKITTEEFDEENQRVIKEFSSIKICNAYMEAGEVMVFAERGNEHADSDDC